MQGYDGRVTGTALRRELLMIALATSRATYSASRRLNSGSSVPRSLRPSVLGPQSPAGTADQGPRTGDLGPRTGDLGPRTGDLGPRTGDLGPRDRETSGPWTQGPRDPGPRDLGTRFPSPVSGSQYRADRHPYREAADMR